MYDITNLPDELEDKIVSYLDNDNDCRRIVISIMYNPTNKMISISIEFKNQQENQNLYKVYSNICNLIQEALQMKLKDVFTNKTYKNKKGDENKGGLYKCLWTTKQETMLAHFEPNQRQTNYFKSNQRQTNQRQTNYFKSNQGRRDYFKSIPMLVDIVTEAMDEWDKRTENVVILQCNEEKNKYEERIIREKALLKNAQKPIKKRAKNPQKRRKSGKVLTYRICKPKRDSILLILLDKINKKDKINKNTLKQLKF